MTATWRMCCCDEGSNPCSGMCSSPWKSSYVVNGIDGQYSYSKTDTMTPACKCDGQTIDVFRRNYYVDVAWAQELGIVVTRQTLPDGSCCYYGQGVVGVTASLEVEETILCCDPPYTLVTTTQVFTRAGFDVPVCVSIRCDDMVDACQNIGAGRKYSLNICICDFPFIESATLNGHEPGETACNQTFTPEDEFGYVMEGICYYFESLVAVPPDAATSAEYSVGSICSRQEPCDQYEGMINPGIPEANACMPCVHWANGLHGAFSIYRIEPFTLGVDDPGTCSCPYTYSAAFIGPRAALIECNDNPGSQCSPCLNYSWTPDCCEVIIEGTAQWPVFT